MTSERWQQIEQVFHNALASSPGERPSVLDRLCKGDDDLRREVQLLLDAERESGSFLASLPENSDPVAEVSPEIGRRIGQYQVLSPLGAGAMGDVYLAWDTRLARQVAVKVLPARFASDRERVSRFIKEAKAASALNHPNLVTIFDGGEFEGRWFIATEFIEGVTLRQRLAGRKLELAEAVDIAAQCAAGLTAAHNAGVSHRDIKPENIMLRPDGLVKILDFGLARVVGSLQDAGATETKAGAILGTPRYMSPEQARGGKSDESSDIFALGAVLYEMATGRPAFPGATTADVLAALLRVEPDRKGVPPEIEAILAKALSKERAGRYPSMREMAAELGLLENQLVLRQLRPPERRRGLTAAVWFAAGILALAGAGAWYWRTAAPGRVSNGGVSASLVPLTTFHGYKYYAVLSPDGRRVAFSWNGGQGGVGGKRERDIYVMPVAGGDPVRLTNSAEDNIWLAWSPDGRQIAFERGASNRTEGNTYYTVSADGGPERKVATGGRGASWSTDGKSLALAHWPAPGKPKGLFLADLQTGQQRELTSPDAAEYDCLPAFSPDGRWVAFTRGVRDEHRGIWIVPATGGTARQIKSPERSLYGLTWTADSREVVYSAIQSWAEARLWRVPIDSGEARLVDLAPENAYAPNIPSGGGRLAFTLTFSDPNIYRSTGGGFNGGANPQPFGPPRLVIESTREDHSPAYSPDGKWVAFVSTRAGAPDLWIQPAEGGRPTQLTNMKSPTLGTPRWSPDGRFIAFDCRTGEVTAIYVVGADGSGLHRVTMEHAANFLPSWSADGRWIHFASDRTGTFQIWRTPAVAAGEAAVQVTRGGGLESWPAPDGKLLYFSRTRFRSAIWSVPVEGGLEQPVPELQEYDRISRSWGVMREGIYFLSRQDGPRQSIRFFSFATRKVTLLARLDKEPTWNVPAVTMSPNGRDLLTVHVDHDVNDLMMLENFR